MIAMQGTAGFNGRTIRATIPAAPATIEAEEMAMLGWMIIVPSTHEGFSPEGVKVVRAR